MSCECGKRKQPSFSLPDEKKAKWCVKCPNKPEEAKGVGSAGKIIQEPLLVENITLRFNFEFNSVDLDDETEEF